MTTLLAGASRAKHRKPFLARVAAVLPHRAYRPGDYCPLHRADRFFPASGDGKGPVFCAESGVLHPRKAA